MRAWIAVLAVALLAGCGNKKYCEREQADYESARESPALKAPPGLTVPEQDPSLQIPPVAPEARARPSEGCLETPPRLPLEPVTQGKPAQKP